MRTRLNQLSAAIQYLWGEGSSYDPNNKEHQEKISEQIRKTRDAFASLAKVDAAIGGAVSLETYLIMSGWAGSWGPWLSIPVCWATAKGIASSMDRAAKVEDFVAARNELFATYHWCMKSGGIPAASDSLLLRVLKTLQPFMQSRDALISTEMKNRMQDMPLDFKRVIDACPDDGRRVWPHPGDQGFAEAMDDVFSDITLVKAVTFLDKQVTNEWATFFSRAAANAVRLGYGDTMQQEQEQTVTNTR